MAEPVTGASWTIRPFSSQAEYERCAEFQEEIWGRGFNERVSAAILMVANKIGGLAAGAYDETGELLGFVFGLTGIREGELVHWSDMLAVRNDYRDRGLGTALKTYQREVLVARGVRVMHWTFDPLQSRNAYVNFTKLGITSSEFVPDMYGDTGSPLHGTGTDRLVATWMMDSERAKRRLAGKENPRMEELEPVPVWALSASRRGEYPEPAEPALELDDPHLLLAVPREIDPILVEAPDVAVAWRKASRAAFMAYLARGYQVRELFPGDAVSHYLLAVEGEESR